MRDINRVILHCTATYEGQDISVDTIRQWHKKRGFSDVGYHYVIMLNGDIELARPVFKQGAHTKGQNEDSIGVAYVGGLDASGEPKNTMTLYQDISFMRLFQSLGVTFGTLGLHGHNEFSNKACPCFDVQDRYKFLID